MRLLFLLISLPIIFFSRVFGQQEVSLLFTAQDEGQYARLDSILVENLTRGCDTILFFPDTSLTLTMITGEEILRLSSAGMVLCQNFPNPFADHTDFMLFIHNLGVFNVSVTDLSGRSRQSGSYRLKKGWHRFRVDAGKAGEYIITFNGQGARRTLRIMALPGAEDEFPDLKYLGPDANDQVPLKSGSAGSFIFQPGDSLRYTGFALTSAFFRGSAYMGDFPSKDTIYHFAIDEGIPCPGLPDLYYQGQKYHTVLIASQCWMKEDLNVGTRLDADSNQTDNGIIEKYCYANQPSNCAIYGGLYQWDEMMQYTMTQGVQGICPAGWHIPTDDEWTLLVDYLGGAVVAGGHLKETGQQHWLSPNAGADNSVGFKALPAGMYFNNAFDHIRSTVEFWSSTYSFSPYAWYRILYNYKAEITRTNYFETWTSRSVRCIKNE